MYKIKDLIEYFPYCYRSEYLSDIVRCCQVEVEQLFSDIVDSEKEYCVSTATYTLEYWDKFVGIDYISDVDIDTMRSSIMASMKSNGTTTVALVKSIAESYSNGTCEIIEDYANYKFTVKFTGTVGVPSRIDEIRKIIDKVKPAHLAYDFEFKYRTWNDIKAYGKTWNEWKALGKTWKDLREGEL
ncbi:hypothetical protein HMPREF0631_1390 [Peptostreptococcus anaerobius 653-L]|uniref:DUF2313 domain-containing protein n=1 Tax=Peptostreptococcus anaerobius 653-L TaxID=596329 RepID=D3MU84_9FIRM|nr:putative phage tail protein [Peptostreptococcus anaerobius]EFD04399.1 hypothetical protein HMPREF0631_1390 [Peptostreptococcus anaerobius 653-L]